ncbi:hypothetical protein [Marinobacter sp.]|uniref:hypothetical protein n=1 Tax=Marinobacter sp. TaxID=50741 RepID=UPI0025C62059|nr:hypothetical protein [Marinobacter sp.]
MFSPQESEAIVCGARIVPLRQEQLKERLGSRFRELDVPLLAEWPDGRREALLFVLEEESDPRRFSIHRLAHYCLDLAELCKTNRVVPVVIFLNANGKEPRQLLLGSEHYEYLGFNYIRCALQELKAEDYWDSDNLIARLCLSLMSWQQDQKLEVYARAVQGLSTLEPDPEKQLKYLDFIDIYAALDDNEMELYQQKYPQESTTMATLSERLRAEGMEKGMQQGMQQGEAAALRKLIALKFEALPNWVEETIQNASPADIEGWLERVLTADSLEKLFE